MISRISAVIISPGRITGMPGGYANIGSAEILPEAERVSISPRGIFTASLRLMARSGSAEA